MVRVALVTGLCCCFQMASAQTLPNPEEEWGDFPFEPTPRSVASPKQQPPVPLASTPPAPPAATGPGLGVAALSPDQPNSVSLFGGQTLGQWKRGQAVFLGFPMLGLKLSLGLLERLDVTVGFESFYGAMNEFHAGFKVGIFRTARWSMAGSVDAMFALFGQRARQENRGARWITGHRNWGLSPGLLLSYQGESPRAIRLFVNAAYLLAFDTDPVSKFPLNGVPPALLLGHNALLRFGAEMPLSARTSFVFLLGLDLHGRSDDAPIMPVASLGLVTGI